MKMKDNNYYAEVITKTIQTITLAIFGLDFIMLALLLT